MLPIYLAVAAVLAVAPTARAQEAVDRQHTEGSEATGKPPVRYAVPRRPAAPTDVPVPQSAIPADEQREAQPRRAPRFGVPRPPTSVPDTRTEVPSPPSAVFADQEGQRRAIPRGTRPRGDNPSVGTAVPRETERRADPGPPIDRGGRVRERDRDRDRTVIVTRPPVYDNYYYYPRRYYPYGYGAFGLGYFYYDPYRWYPRSYSMYGPGYYHGGYYRSRFGFDIGELRLRVTPRHAQVFVDGYYAGVVDDFDGAFQGLKLESGPYRIEIVAPGYEPLEFDIRISPEQKITYRGDLLRRP